MEEGILICLQKLFCLKNIFPKFEHSEKQYFIDFSIIIFLFKVIKWFIKTLIQFSKMGLYV